MLKKIEEKLSKYFYGEINYYRKKGMNIGENCSLLGKVKFGSEPYLISIGNNVKITDGVKFITHDGGVHVIRNINNLPNIDKFGTIVIGNNVFIGTNSIILPNVTIGNNVIIGAGSVITKSITNNCVVAGVPGRVISTLEEYLKKNEESFLETKQLSYDEKSEFLKKYFFDK